MALKRCLSCRQIKTSSEYYQHPGMADGRLGKCKKCCKRDAIANRQKNLERYLQYDRNRAMLPHRVAQRAAYQKTVGGKKVSNAAKKRWIARNQDRRAAHRILANAVKYGRLVRQPCEICNSTRTHGHHDDYTQPLKVRWLCPAHHREIHK